MRSEIAHGTFDEAISRADPHVQAIARRLRDLIVDVFPNVIEVPWQKQQIVGYGVGPKKMTEHFCYISVQSSYANLGFNYGVNLPDPEQLMEGSGKEFRHVKILKVADAEQPGLKRLLEEAVAERMLALNKNLPGAGVS